MKESGGKGEGQFREAGKARRASDKIQEKKRASVGWGRIKHHRDDPKINKMAL